MGKKKKEPAEKHEISAAKLQELIRQEQERKTKACSEEIAKVLDKHKCEIAAIPQFVQGAGGLFAVKCLWGVQVKVENEG